MNLRDNPMHDALLRGEVVEVTTGVGVSFTVPVGGLHAANANCAPPSLRSRDCIAQVAPSLPATPREDV